MEHSTPQTNSGFCLVGRLAEGASLTMDPSAVHIGDPPPGPFPGTAWISDFPPSPIKVQQPLVSPNVATLPYVPNPGGVVVGGLDVGALLTSNPWNLTWHPDRVVARCDVPGAKDAIDVSITNGIISVSYKRFDTGGIVHPAVQLIGTAYDPKTAEATLEAGVLTVTVMLDTKKTAHKVPVTVK